MRIVELLQKILVAVPLVILLGFIPDSLKAAQDVNRYATKTISELQEKFYKVDIDEKIDVEIESESLDEALQQIARGTGLKLTYRGDIMVDKKVSLVSEQIGVSDALAQILHGTSLEFLFSKEGYLLITSNAEETENAIVQQTIRGQVTNAASGETLPGVNIMVQDTNIGTTTDLEGNYELIVPDDANTIVFSFIGFASQQIGIDGRTTINVTLEQELGYLDELVVVGYSTRTRRDLSSSIQTVTEDQVSNVSSPDIGSRLRGQSSGVFVTAPSGRPGQNPNIRIRGTGSITASAEPLYVVDGMIGSINDVSPNDVESITVLKDADATALYGSRAANGVILINTKTGRPGETTINVNTRTGVNFKDMGGFQVMNSQQLYDLHSQVVEVPQSRLETDTDWVEHAFRRAVTQNHEVSASAGTETTRFYISGRYYNEQGIIGNSSFNGISGRVNIEHDLHDRLRVIARLSGNNRVDERNTSPVLSDFMRYLPWDRPYNEDGTLRDGRELDWLSREQRNFLHDMEYNWRDIRTQNYTGDLRVEYYITDWLTFSTSNRAGFNYFIDEEYIDPLTQVGSATNGRTDKSTGFTNNFLTSNLLNADRSYGEHNYGGLVGFEYSRNRFENLGVSAIRGSSGLTIIDTMAEPRTMNGTISESAFISGLFQGFYNYGNRYAATASYRIDGSSRFGADNRYGNFYSVGASWMVNNEDFFDVSAISMLKLRSSYGTTGNAEIGNYIAQGLYDFGYQYAGTPAAIRERLANPVLTWEVAHELNFGLDIAFVERVELTLDVYQRNNRNLLQDVPVERTSGFTDAIRNIGEVRNRGFEANVTSVNIQGRFNWTTNFNIGVNRNVVTSLHEGEDIILTNHRIREGENVHTFYLRKWAGVDPDNGDPLWEYQTLDDDENVISTELTNDYNLANRQSVGTPTPDFIGGIGNRFDYRGFSLNTFFHFVYGNQVYNPRGSLDHDGAYITHNAWALHKDESRWEQPGDQTTHPRFVFGGNNQAERASSRWLEDGSYLRLQNITLSYNLPVSALQSLGLNSARIYVSGDNLLTLDKNFKGMDPEVGIQGISSNRFPMARKTLFGIDVSF